MRSSKLWKTITTVTAASLALSLGGVTQAETISGKQAAKKQDAEKQVSPELAAVPPAPQKTQPHPAPVNLPTAATPTTARPAELKHAPEPYQGTPRLFSGTIMTGYHSGPTFYAGGTFNQVATGFPFGVRVGVERSIVNPGDAWLARAVFINGNTNGTARKKGKTWDARLDLLYPITFLKLDRTNVFFGGRYTDFDAYFEYIGGAETFDVFSHHFGVGGGLETAFAMSARVDLLVSAGLDYYFPGTIDGHDTYYRPNNYNTHPIDNYTYQDADAAINQPDVATRITFGIGYHF